MLIMNFPGPGIETSLLLAARPRVGRSRLGWLAPDVANVIPFTGYAHRESPAYRGENYCRRRRMAEKVKPFGTVALVIGAMLVTTSAVAEPVYATEETLVADRAAFKQIAATAASNILSDEVRKIAALLQGDLGNAIRFRPTPSQIDAIAATLQDAEAL